MKDNCFTVLFWFHSAIWQCESAISIHMSPPSWASLPPPIPSHPLGYHRALGWVPCSTMLFFLSFWASSNIDDRRLVVFGLWSCPLFLFLLAQIYFCHSDCIIFINYPQIHWLFHLSLAIEPSQWIFPFKMLYFSTPKFPFSFSSYLLSLFCDFLTFHLIQEFLPLYVFHKYFLMGN